MAPLSSVMSRARGMSLGFMNHLQHRCYASLYQLDVVTAGVRGAGIGSGVRLNLYGGDDRTQLDANQCDSISEEAGGRMATPMAQLHIAGSNGRFNRGTRESFFVLSDEPLHLTTRMHVRIAKTPTHQGWRLYRIDVRRHGTVDSATHSVLSESTSTVNESGKTVLSDAGVAAVPAANNELGITALAVEDGCAVLDNGSEGTLRINLSHLEHTARGKVAWLESMKMYQAIPAISPIPALPGATSFYNNEWIGVDRAGNPDKSCTVDLIPTRDDFIQLSPRSLPWARLESPLKMRHSCACFPRPDKVKTGARGKATKTIGHAGEDAYGIFFNGPLRMFVIADGVNAWSARGIDAGIYAQQIVRECGDVFENMSLENPDLSLNTILEEAYSRVVEQGTKGSCTVALCLVHTETGLAQSLNLGDSGFIVLRPCQGELAADKPTKGTATHDHFHVVRDLDLLEHEFGRPYQLGHHANSDSPSDGLVNHFMLERGDVLLGGSDGLWDNLSFQDIGDLLLKQKHFGLAAVPLSIKAYDVSMDSRAASPWAEAASEEFEMHYEGGKQDDLCVVLAEFY
eukprot:m.187778 g.187778  ORF g.187778 m.187778 type:complete len:571 (-) comp14780_c0_seq1:256-1968(-)